MRRRGLEVLAEGEDPAADLAQVLQRLSDFLRPFAQPQHQAGLGRDQRSRFPCAAQQLKRAAVIGPGPDPGIKPGDRFDVVVEDIRPRAQDGFEGGAIPLEIRDQDLDLRLWHPAADFADGRRKVSRAAVRQVVAGDGSDHRVFQTHALDGFGDTAWLIQVERLGKAGGHRTEAAVAGAALAQDEKGRRAVGITLPDVRALGLLADGVQLSGFDELPHLVEGLAGRQAAFQPIRLAEGWGLGCGIRHRVYP